MVENPLMPGSTPREEERRRPEQRLLATLDAQLRRRQGLHRAHDRRHDAARRLLARRGEIVREQRDSGTVRVTARLRS